MINPVKKFGIKIEKYKILAAFTLLQTMWYKLIIGLLVISLVEIGVEVRADSYEDKRCKCICPSLSSVLNNTQETDRMMVIENVSRLKCDCENVIMPRIADKIKGKEREFCPRCQCKFENRNTSIIKFVVILVIWVISLLVVYMLFLICLDPLLNKRVKANYQEHTNEEDDVTLSGVAGPSVHVMGVRNNVLNRVGHQQDKWKRQVREQRKNIYDRHTMLN